MQLPVFVLLFNSPDSCLVFPFLCASYHQDIPAIVVKNSFDNNDEQRGKLNHLLSKLHKQNVISTKQMSAGFRKLFNSLEDLVLDVPNAKTLLIEFVGMATASGYLSGSDAGEMERMITVLADKKVRLACASLVSSRFLVR